MTISMDKYVKINSKVGGADAESQRELILRLFTTSTLASPSTALEFESADEVATFFGEDSDEHLRAKSYFSYISPALTRPRKISFARDMTSASAPQVIGSAPESVANIKAAATKAGNSMGISYKTGTSGTLNSYAIENINLASATTYAQIATALQTAIRARFASNSVSSLKNMTVIYDSTRGAFVASGTSGDDITFMFSTLQWDLTKAVGLYSDVSTGAGATVVGGNKTTGSAADSVADAIDVSNNFGTFSFIRTLTTAEHLAIATANAARNVEFEYIVPVTSSNAEEVSAALFALGGTSLVLVADTNTEYDELLPAAIKAATRYDKSDSVVSYMYREQEGLTAKVTNTDVSNAMDLLRVNYYGQTQAEGTKRSFYQRGVMMGGTSDLVDQNIYANEQWLKDDARNGFMNLFRDVGRVSANPIGQNKLVNTLQQTIDQAVENGTISVGKDLTSRQKQYITEQADDDTVWVQVQNIGYWYKVGMESYPTKDGRTEWRATYTLIYSKDDTIRQVVGDDLLI